MVKQSFAKIGFFLFAVFFNLDAIAAQCTDVFQANDGINEDLPEDRRLTYDSDDWPDPDDWPDSGAELSGGDYYFKKEELSQGYELSVSPGAAVRIFVDGDVSFGNSSIINTPASSDRRGELLLLVDGKVEFKKGAVFTGVVYSAGEQELKNDVQINGIVAIEDDDGLDQKNKADVNYVPETLDPRLFDQLCEIEQPATLPAFDNFESYSPGSIDGNDGGSNWGGPWTGQDGQVVVDTSDSPLEFVDSEDRRIRSATSLEIAGNGNEVVTRPLDGTFSGDSVFLSMLVRFNGDPTNNDFVGFWVENSGFGASPQFGLKVNEGSGGVNDFFVRLDQTADYATDIEVGETYLLVAQYTKARKITSVTPSSGLTLHVAQAHLPPCLPNAAQRTTS
ncbi:hypothetical protein AU14_13610 [Marinobacter similis]|uniref:PA14 domain-containing protein n=2 Tax=Marinobacter similis TaxID=1420916 RepID=W5YML6_9GAMM|nr:hypothetical protein AU14_13610 [Marinobacter similis]